MTHDETRDMYYTNTDRKQWVGPRLDADLYIRVTNRQFFATCDNFACFETTPLWATSSKNFVACPTCFMKTHKNGTFENNTTFYCAFARDVGDERGGRGEIVLPGV